MTNTEFAQEVRTRLESDHAASLSEAGLCIVATDELTTIRARLAETERERDAARDSASRLATTLWRMHYREQAPGWEPFTDLPGLISQIDNMAAGLAQKATAAEARAEKAERLVMEIETCCHPAGTHQELIEMRDQHQAAAVRLVESTARLAEVERERDAAKNKLLDMEYHLQDIGGGIYPESLLRSAVLLKEQRDAAEARVREVAGALREARLDVQSLADERHGLLTARDTARSRIAALEEALREAERMMVEQEDALRSFDASEPNAESAILRARALLAPAAGEGEEPRCRHCGDHVSDVECVCETTPTLTCSHPTVHWPDDGPGICRVCCEDVPRAPTAAPEWCGTCGGSGRVAAWPHEYQDLTCRTCGGEGRTVATPAPEKPTTCPRCHVTPPHRMSCPERGSERLVMGVVEKGGEDCLCGHARRQHNDDGAGCNAREFSDTCLCVEFIPTSREEVGRG